MSSAAALAESSGFAPIETSANLHLAQSGQRAGSSYEQRNSDSYDYNVPLALPPYGYAPSFWGYGGRRYYDRFGNYKKYGQEPGEPDTGPVETRPLR
jgi:hypothetical protein